MNTSSMPSDTNAIEGHPASNSSSTGSLDDTLSSLATSLAPIPASNILQATAATTDLPTDADGSTNDDTRAQIGPEIHADDSNGLPLPTGMAETILETVEADEVQATKSSGRVEQITDSGVCPDPLSAVFESNALGAFVMGTEKHAARVEQINDDDQIPFSYDSSQFEGATNIIKKMKLGAEREEGSMPEGQDHTAENETEMPPLHTGPVDTDLDVDLDLGNEDDEELGNTNGSTPNDPLHAIATNQQLPEVDTYARAYTVEDGDGRSVIIATPLEPWWKQRRARILLALFLLVVALAIAFGVLLSSGNDPGLSPAVTFVVEGTDAPSVSAIPSAYPSIQSSTSPSSIPSTTPSFEPSKQPSATPSVSLAPSSSPSSCVDTISLNRQTMDFQLDLPRYPKVAVDGKNMVAVVRDDLSSTTHTMFYELIDGMWVKNKQFEYNYDSYGYYDVAISAKTVFVGLPHWGDDHEGDSEGVVLVYELGEFGWEERSDPFDHGNSSPLHSNFGRYIDIDRDLACVTDHYDEVHLFHRIDNKWVQFTFIEDSWECWIVGDTIAIYGRDDSDEVLKLYQYQRHLNRIELIQDPIVADDVVTALDIGRDHLVFSEYNYGGLPHQVNVFYREGSNDFTLVQKLNISVSWNPQPSNRLSISVPRDSYLAVNNNLLAIGGYNHTDIYTFHNGYWVTTLVLDEPHGLYQLSDRNLFVTDKTDEIHYYNLDTCMQAWPTQMPSSSMTPSSTPTMAPSTSPLPSLLPSTSITPTEECYWIAITVIYDDWPTNNSWMLYNIYSNVHYVLKMYTEDDKEATFHTENICLKKGEYKFVISHNWNFNHESLSFHGHYNVTTSDGVLIAERGDFLYGEETTQFSIPFEPSPYMVKRRRREIPRKEG